MDRECMKLLPRVCKALAVSGQSLPDDTSLEKLLDMFSGFTDTESCPCLSEFIFTVIHNVDPDPSILSFAFKLTGLLSATGNGFRQLQKDSLLGLVFDPHRWQEAGLWDDPCVRIGWVQGLKAMLQHAAALHFLVESDLTKTLLQLQTDTSLFVAAAANQMLAHILVFQPLSSEGCADVEMNEKKARGCIRASDQIDPDIQHLALTLGTSRQYAMVTMAILEHFKVSLVSKESKELGQMLQSLKLLTLIFGQARAPLSGILLKTVLDFLEALVAERCSQLTLLLLEVLLTASSCTYPDKPTSDMRVGSLISQMLDIYKPPELIDAAAAVLRREHSDLRHKAKAARILLLPLQMITGLTLFSMQTAGAADQLSPLAELLNSKTPCVSLLCVCLTHVAQITRMPAEVLLCPARTLIPAILSLLIICEGQASSTSNGSIKACRNLIGCGKVQKCGLEALTAFTASPGAEERLSDVIPVLKQYLNNPDSEPTVLHKSYQALVKWISVCIDLPSLMGGQFGQDLLMIVRKRVCDVRWEVRDSTVEFLGQLVAVSHSKQSHHQVCVSENVLDCSITPCLVEALRDSESYVRASAITALAQTLAHSWQQGAAPKQEQTALVDRLLEILSEDTEGFARRAVVQYFIAWFSAWNLNTPGPSPPSLSLLMSSVCTVLSRGSADLDWEVKVHTLELAQLLLDQALSPHHKSMSSSETHPTASPQLPHPYAVTCEPARRPHSQAGTQPADLAAEGLESELTGALKGLQEHGVISTLLTGLFDCDRPVALKACRLLKALRDAVCPLSDTNTTPATVARVSCELRGCVWEREVRALLEKNCNLTHELSAPDANESNCIQGFGRWVDYMEGDGTGQEGGSGPVRVCDVLCSLDLDDRLAVLTQSSDHVHNSPLSLLQDILSVRDTHAEANVHPAQEVIVDCY